MSIGSVQDDVSRPTFGQFQTVCDLAEHFQVPGERIILDPLPFTATEADLLDWNAKHGICELVDRTLIMKRVPIEDQLLSRRYWDDPEEQRSMAVFESFVTQELNFALLSFVKQSGLGRVADAQAIQRTNTDERRIPDLSVFTTETMRSVYPSGKVATLPKVFPRIADIAIEILSESNTNEEIARKRREYFDSGSRLVWIVDPRGQTVEVWTGTDTPDSVLTRSDTLTGGDVLPGFELSIDQWFSDAEAVG